MRPLALCRKARAPEKANHGMAASPSWRFDGVAPPAGWFQQNLS
jgi:hypothetical protein